MNGVSLVEAVSAGIGAAIATGETFRRYMVRRGDRERAEFRESVQKIVDEAVKPMLERQAEFARRQSAHLDRQDQAIAQIRRDIQRFHGEG